MRMCTLIAEFNIKEDKYDLYTDLKTERIYDFIMEFLRSEMEKGKIIPNPINSMSIKSKLNWILLIILKLFPIQVIRL